VIKVDEPDLPSIKLGDSDAVRVGDIVAAVGNPFGLEGTATLGIVSAVMRSEIGHGLFEDYLQIDAQIHPGNSGGALVNVRGELIGINTVGGERRSLGIGFAVPLNMARVIMAELITAGRMRRGSTGLIVADLPMEMASPREGGVTRGAIVRKVLPKSPAAAAGIEPGSVVVSAGNRPVRSAAEFVTRTATVPVGSSIPIVLFAKGQGQSVSLISADTVIDPEEIALPAEIGSLAGAVVGEILLGNRLYGDVLGAEVLRGVDRSAGAGRESVRRDRTMSAAWRSPWASSGAAQRETGQSSCRQSAPAPSTQSERSSPWSKVAACAGWGSSTPAPRRR
jgi:serine protease DegQ